MTAGRAQEVARRRPVQWREPLVAWAVTRGLILVATVVLSYALGVPHLGVDPAVPRWLALLGGWDTSWYLDIATRGYDDYTGLAGVLFTNLPFFPLVPMVMKVGIALHVNPFVFAVAVNNVAFLGALVGIHRLSAERFGAARARLVVWAFAALPPSVYASMAYTEALTLAMAVGAAILAQHRRWGWAASAAAVATLGRPPGVLVALLVAVFAWQAGGPRSAQVRRVALVMAPAALTLAGFLAAMQITRGAWDLPFVAQAAWRRGPLGIGVLTYLPVEIGDAVRAAFNLDVVGLWAPVVRDGLPTLGYAFLLRRLWRMEGGWRNPWFIYSAAVLALPLSSGSFESMTRFGLMAFPLVWPAAEWMDEGGERRRTWVLVASLVLCVIAVGEMRIEGP